MNTRKPSSGPTRKPAAGARETAREMRIRKDAMQSVLRALRSSFFGPLPTHILEALAGMAEVNVFEAGTVVFRTGDPGGYLYGIVAGELKLYVSDGESGTEEGLDESRSTTLRRFGPGEVGGEIAVLDGGLRSASGVTTTRTVMFTIPAEEFNQYVLSQPKLARFVTLLLCARLRRSTNQVEDFLFRTLPQRLAKQLYVLGNPDTADDGSFGSVRLSQKELAEFLNSSRPVVNGLLKDWQKEGYVLIQRARIELLDIEGLCHHVGIEPPTSDEIGVHA